MSTRLYRRDSLRMSATLDERRPSETDRSTQWTSSIPPAVEIADSDRQHVPQTVNIVRGVQQPNVRGSSRKASIAADRKMPRFAVHRLQGLIVSTN